MDRRPGTATAKCGAKPLAEMTEHADNGMTWNSEDIDAVDPLRYEREFAEKVERYLYLIDSVQVHGVRLDNFAGRTSLIIHFRLGQRPECLFGWRVWIWRGERGQRPFDEDPANIVRDLSEWLDGEGHRRLLEPCDDGITWIDANGPPPRPN